MVSIPESVEELRLSLVSVADNQKKKWMEAYMRNQFLFFGVPAPVRKKIQKQWFSRIFSFGSELPVSELIFYLFQLDQREFQYVAVDLLDRYAHTLSDLERSDILQECITTKSWWDTVDVLAVSVAGKWLSGKKNLQRKVICHWNASDNLWLRRTAILHQIKYKSKTDFDLLCACILNSAYVDNFFVQKAIGWALREYSKTEPKMVTTFVLGNEKRLSPLARREALKWLTRQS